MTEQTIAAAGSHRSEFDVSHWRLLPSVRAKVIAFVLTTYVPLLVLSGMQGVCVNRAVHIPFLFDITEAVRFLLVGPLLIGCDLIINPWLAQIGTYIRERVITAPDLWRFEKLVQRVNTLSDSPTVSGLLLAATFAWQFVDTSFGIWSAQNTWRDIPGSNVHTYAWFFYAYFGKPLVRFLWLRWLWRYSLWAWLLIKLSRQQLKIMPTHPDRNGGLGFISVGHSKFAVLAFTFGLQAAGILATRIFLDGKPLWSFRYDVLGVVAISLFVFLAPFLAFTGKLLEAKRCGLFEYGALADDYVCSFREKWVSGKEKTGETLLGTSDLQSLADLDNSYSIVREMQTCLITKFNLTTFAVATLLPFVPLLLSVYPFDDLLKHLLKFVV